MWGSTILDTEEADLAKEVDKAFSTKPCYRMNQIFASIQNEEEKESISKKCLMWSMDQYEGANSLKPAFCKVCDKSTTDIKDTEMLEKEIEAQQQPKDEEESDIDFENTIDPLNRRVVKRDVEMAFSTT